MCIARSALTLNWNTKDSYTPRRACVGAAPRGRPPPGNHRGLPLLQTQRKCANLVWFDLVLLGLVWGQLAIGNGCSV